MSEEELKELQEYNLEYLEAQNSEEIFGGDYTSAVELKYANKEIERLNKLLDETRQSELHKEYVINELERWLGNEYISGNYEELYRIGLKDCHKKLQELKGSDKE